MTLLFSNCLLLLCLYLTLYFFPGYLFRLLSSEKLFKCSVFLNSLYSLSVCFCFFRFKASIGKGRVHFWYGVLKKNLKTRLVSLCFSLLVSQQFFFFSGLSLVFSCLGLAFPLSTGFFPSGIFSLWVFFPLLRSLTVFPFLLSSFCFLSLASYSQRKPCRYTDNKVTVIAGVMAMHRWTSVFLVW